MAITPDVGIFRAENGLYLIVSFSGGNQENTIAKGTEELFAIIKSLLEE